tara:strand:+ start:310 stop:504 length:195 start_codon:yes stop_codon:yes gene_type:complete
MALKGLIMNYIWNDNYPIAIHITEGEWSPERLQSIANHEQLIVRDIRLGCSTREPSVDYYPENA